MSAPSSYLDEIRDLLAANGWEDDLEAEPTDPPPGISAAAVRVRVKGADAATAVVGVYCEGIAPPMQVFDECLRFLRMRRALGRP